MVDGVQENQVGHRFAVEVEEPFPHLVGLEEDGTVRTSAAEKRERSFVQRAPAVFEGAAAQVSMVVQDVGHRRRFTPIIADGGPVDGPPSAHLT